MDDGFEIKLVGMDDVLKALEALPKEVVSKRGGPVRAALRKGALVIRDQARANVRAIVAEPNVDGRASRSKGALEKAITVTRGKPPDGSNGERYLVWTGRVSYRYANTRANVRAGRVGATYTLDPPQFYGKFLEYGTSTMRAHPWLRPAFQAKRVEAVRVVETELIKGIDRIVKKLFKTGGLE